MSAGMHPGPAERFRRRQALRSRISAVVLLSFMAGIVALTVALYNQSFTTTADVTVRAERAGLQMRKGTVVKLRGVDVGKIGESTLNSDGTVDIEMELKPEMLSMIPSNVGVSLEQLTAFGNKHIALTMPTHPAATMLRAGDVIDATRVTVEVNTVYKHLARVLSAAHPAKVNAVLGALAESLQGQGENVGRTIDTLNAYLGKVNRDLPALHRDFEKGSDVLDVYADSAPDLMSVLANATTTATSISQQEHSFSAFLDSLDRVSNRGTFFFARNSAPLIDLLSSSLPTTELLQRYSPGFACFLKGLDKANRDTEHAFGTRLPGLIANVTVMASDNQAYVLPDQLPRMDANDGPDCSGLTGYDGKTYFDLKRFDRGGTAAHPVPDGDAPVRGDNVLQQLFGTALIGGATP